MLRDAQLGICDGQVGGPAVGELAEGGKCDHEGLVVRRDEGEQAAPETEGGHGHGHGPVPAADLAAEDGESHGAEDEAEVGGEGEEELFGG